jgi:YbbR domain-containing protein
MQSNISKRKAFYIALSILVAVSIWIYVDVSNDRTATVTIRDIPIEYLNEDTILADRGLMLLEDGTDTSVDLELTATRWNIAQLDKSELRIQADLSNVTSVGTQNISYRIIYPPNRNFSNIYTISDQEPIIASINVGELYSREVDVRCEIQGKVADGYTAGELQISPGILEIRGEQEMIDLVSYAKVVLSLDDAETTVSEQLEYQFYDQNDQLLEKTGIHATADQVQVTLPVNVTKEVRLTMNFIQSPGAQLENVAYEIMPSTITVSGDAAQLKDIDTIVLDDFNLLSLGMGTTEYHHVYAITVPEGCENLSGVTRATLNISFRDMTSATVTATEFQLENIPAGKDIDLLTQELAVTVFGPAAEVNAVTADSITVRVDLANLSAAAGSYTVPAAVEIGNNNIGIAGTYQVRLTIREYQETPEPEPEPDSGTNQPSTPEESQ